MIRPFGCVGLLKRKHARRFPCWRLDSVSKRERGGFSGRFLPARQKQASAEGKDATSALQHRRRKNRPLSRRCWIRFGLCPRRSSRTGSPRFEFQWDWSWIWFTALTVVLRHILSVSCAAQKLLVLRCRRFRPCDSSHRYCQSTRLVSCLDARDQGRSRGGLTRFDASSSLA